MSPSALSTSSEKVVVSIALASGSDLLEPTHKFMTEYVRQRYLPTAAQALGVGIYELLSNAANYGSVAGTVLLELLEGPSSIAVRVTNEAIPMRIERLQQVMTKLAGGAEAVFLAEMRRSLEGAGARATLGLARAAHEGSLSLDASVEGRKVTVTARLAK